MSNSEMGSRQAVEGLLARARARRAHIDDASSAAQSEAAVAPTRPVEAVETPPSSYRIDQFESYQALKLQKALADQVGLENPFFRLHDGIASAMSSVEGKEVLNFATYNYLDLNGHPAVTTAAIEAIGRYGV